MSLRTAKAGEAFYEVISVFDLDGVTPLSGESSSDFTVSFFHNGEAPSEDPSYSLGEIDSTGQYALTVGDGFEDNGFWVISVLVGSTDDTFRTDIEVRTRDIDDVYSVIAGGFGSQAVLLTITDSSNGSSVAGMRASVWNAAQTTFITFGQTDSSGEVSFALDPDDYSVLFFKPGVSVDTYSLTVETSEDPQEVDISATAVEVSPPADPSVCRIYADFIDQAGSAIEGFVVSVANLFDPSASSGLTVVESYTSHTSDSEGHIEFDVVMGTRIKVSLVNTNLTRDLTVPSQPVVSLFDLLGSVTDPFQVVEDSSNPFVVVSVG
jgi:hypothetical protein